MNALEGRGLLSFRNQSAGRVCVEKRCLPSCRADGGSGGKACKMAVGDVSVRAVVAKSERQARGLICDLLRSAGIREIFQSEDGNELLDVVDRQRPRIVIASAHLPNLTGLDITRRIRAGHHFVPRETSVILTTRAPTQKIIQEARLVGIDEIVAVPFTGQALTARVRSVLDRPRPFIDCPSYVGPCRRRKMLQDYKGPLRRMTDPATETLNADNWSYETPRSAIRKCIQKFSEHSSSLSRHHQVMMREIYQSVMRQDTRASQDEDLQLGMTAKSLGIYLSGIPAGGILNMARIEEDLGALQRGTAGASRVAQKTETRRDGSAGAL